MCVCVWGAVPLAFTRARHIEQRTPLSRHSTLPLRERGGSSITRFEPIRSNSGGTTRTEPSVDVYVRLSVFLECLERGWLCFFSHSLSRSFSPWERGLNGPRCGGDRRASWAWRTCVRRRLCGDAPDARPLRALEHREDRRRDLLQNRRQPGIFRYIYNKATFRCVCVTTAGLFFGSQTGEEKKTPFSDSGAPRSRGCASIQAKSSAAVRSPAPLKEPFTALASPRQEHALPVSWPREKAVFSASNVERATLFFQRRAGEAPVKRDLSNGTSITCCAGGLFVFAA